MSVVLWMDTTEVTAAFKSPYDCFPWFSGIRTIYEYGGPFCVDVNCGFHTNWNVGSAGIKPRVCDVILECHFCGQPGSHRPSLIWLVSIKLQSSAMKLSSLPGVVWNSYRGWMQEFMIGQLALYCLVLLRPSGVIKRFFRLCTSMVGFRWCDWHQINLKVLMNVNRRISSPWEMLLLKPLCSFLPGVVRAF